MLVCCHLRKNGGKEYIIARLCLICLEEYTPQKPETLYFREETG